MAYKVIYVTEVGGTAEQTFQDKGSAIRFMCVYDPDGIYPMELWDIEENARVVFLESNRQMERLKNNLSSEPQPKPNWTKEGF